MNLTIAYSTCRREPHFDWFFESLARQCDLASVRVVVVDYFAEEAGRRELLSALCPGVIHVSPKPSVWQGLYRLTSRDYFAPSNARNTALCHASDGWIAYADDLSVLMPGWMACVQEAMRLGHVRLGAYRKVCRLVVRDGLVVSFENHHAGWDTRWHSGSASAPVTASGSWMFGCSLVAPVEAFLAVNGWDEDCDPMGGEDYAAGMMMERHGWQFAYDRRMLTFESEEDHHKETPFLRIDKGASPNDASHRMLAMLLGGRDVAPNYFGAGGIRAVRGRVLAGEAFPSPPLPEHDWRDGQPLREM